MMSGSTADHSQFAANGSVWRAGLELPSPTVNVLGLNAIQYPSPCGPVSLMAVESAFHVRWNPASVDMNDRPALVFWSVTRKMREPKVGSVMTEFAGPRAGAGGIGRTFVSVMAVYVDGATCA